MDQELIKAIEKKYRDMGENPETYLKGLLQAKPINYWDYVEVETLLSLQKPRTGFKDEEIFIMYHQVTELVLKLMLHEIRQLAGDNDPDEQTLLVKLGRLNRYTSMLITSFDIMKEGMDYDDYNTFRATLAPASGFQSAQFRFIELYCTPLINLVNEEGKKRLNGKPSTEEYFEHIYWKDAGLDRKTGKKTYTLHQFEEKYLNDFIHLANKVKGKTIADKIMVFGNNLSPELKAKLKEFDRLYNVEWPLVHLNTAKHYLDSRGENKAATGGSQWKKYLHPHFQQRKFFPELWTDVELDTWGGTGMLENIQSADVFTKTIGEIVAVDFRAAAVFSKYGIDYCCKGNRTVQEAVENRDLSAGQLLQEIKLIIGQNTEVPADIRNWPVDLLTDYIEKKHHRYVEETIPVLKQFLNKTCQAHGDKYPELWEIEELFDQSAGELTVHMKKEELLLFPHIRKIFRAQNSKEKLNGQKLDVGNPVETMMRDHELEGDRFAQISVLSNKYTPPSDACSTFRATFAMLKSFEKDLHMHIHLENNILFPKALELEKAII